MGVLTGVAALITRPELQSQPLAQLFESYGATAVRLPVMRIEPVESSLSSSGWAHPVAPFDLVIFTSANAVRFGARLIDAGGSHRLAAVGPATARALAAAGLGTAEVPAAGFDTESLLLHPLLTSAVTRRILIVTGARGRSLLHRQLVERGADVTVAEVYERKALLPNAPQLAAVESSLRAMASIIITATSVEIVCNLLELATPALSQEIDRAHWIVPSDRVASVLRQRLTGVAFIRAESAEDHDLVAAALRWRASVSSA